MKVNNPEVFLEKARGGKPPFGCCMTFADPAVTEVAVASGFDFVWIDGEHGEMDRNTAMLHLMVVKGTDVATLYRVPGTIRSGASPARRLTSWTGVHFPL